VYFGNLDEVFYQVNGVLHSLAAVDKEGDDLDILVKNATTQKGRHEVFRKLLKSQQTAH